MRPPNTEFLSILPLDGMARNGVPIRRQTLHTIPDGFLSASLLCPVASHGDGYDGEHPSGSSDNQQIAHGHNRSREIRFRKNNTPCVRPSVRPTYETSRARSPCQRFWHLALACISLALDCTAGVARAVCVVRRSTGSLLNRPSLLVSFVSLG